MSGQSTCELEVNFQPLCNWGILNDTEGLNRGTFADIRERHLLWDDTWLVGHAIGQERRCLCCQADKVHSNACSLENRASPDFTSSYTSLSWLSLSKSCTTVRDGRGPWVGRPWLSAVAVQLELLALPQLSLSRLVGFPKHRQPSVEVAVPRQKKFECYCFQSLSDFWREI